MLRAALSGPRCPLPSALSAAALARPSLTLPPICPPSLPSLSLPYPLRLSLSSLPYARPPPPSASLPLSPPCEASPAPGSPRPLPRCPVPDGCRPPYPPSGVEQKVPWNAMFHGTMFHSLVEQKRSTGLPARLWRAQNENSIPSESKIDLTRKPKNEPAFAENPSPQVSDFQPQTNFLSRKTKKPCANSAQKPNSRNYDSNSFHSFGSRASLDGAPG